MAQGELRRRDDGAIECVPVGDQAQVEARAQLAPEAHLAACCRHSGLKQPAAALLDLIDQKRQHHQLHQHGAEVLAAVTEVVLEVIALVLEGVEGLLLDLPARAGTSHQDHQIVFSDGDVRHPGEVGHGAVGGVLPVLQEIDLEREVGVVERRAVKVAEAVANTRIVSQGDLSGLRSRLDPVEQEGVVALLGTEDELEIQRLQMPDVRGIGGQGVFDAAY